MNRKTHPYFAILYSCDTSAEPMMNKDGSLRFFETLDESERAAFDRDESNTFEVFKLGDGA